MRNILITLFDKSCELSNPYKAAGWEIINIEDIQADYKNLISPSEDQQFVNGFMVNMPDTINSDDMKYCKDILRMMGYFGNWHWGYHGGLYQEGETEFFWMVKNPNLQLISEVPEYAGAVTYALPGKKGNDTILFGEFKIPSNGISVEIYQELMLKNKRARHLISQGYAVLECPYCSKFCNPVSKLNSGTIVYQTHECTNHSPYYFKINSNGDLIT